MYPHETGERDDVTGTDGPPSLPVPPLLHRFQCWQSPLLRVTTPHLPASASSECAYFALNGPPSRLG